MKSYIVYRCATLPCCVRSCCTSILQDNVKGVNDSWDVTQDGEKDVNQQIRTASPLEEDTNGRDEDREASWIFRIGFVTRDVGTHKIWERVYLRLRNIGDETYVPCKCQTR